MTYQQSHEPPSRTTTATRKASQSTPVVNQLKITTVSHRGQSLGLGRRTAVISFACRSVWFNGHDLRDSPNL